MRAIAVTGEHFGDMARHGTQLQILDRIALVDNMTYFVAGKAANIRTWNDFLSVAMLLEFLSRATTRPKKCPEVALRKNQIIAIGTMKTRTGASVRVHRTYLLQIRTMSEEAMASVVIGATGIVGSYIIQRLLRAGEKPLAVSRDRQSSDSIDWMQADLLSPQTLKFQPFETLYCTAPASLLVDALPSLLNPSLKRVVIFTSSSIDTKMNSEIKSERELLRSLVDAEQKIKAICEQAGIGWTILRPTIIYAEGRDGNISRLARVIDKIGFMPLAGNGAGRRQPVHAEDLAIGAIAAAASSAASNKTYALPGTEIITYREMVGRVFDGLDRRRRVIPIPLFLWKLIFLIIKPLFPGFNVAMGTRMAKDMVFDPSPAIQDFGWNPRTFRPQFGTRADA